MNPALGPSQNCALQSITTPQHAVGARGRIAMRVNYDVTTTDFVEVIDHDEWQRCKEERLLGSDVWVDFQNIGPRFDLDLSDDGSGASGVEVYDTSLADEAQVAESLSPSVSSTTSDLGH